jgi:hypothetical protein
VAYWSAVLDWELSLYGYLFRFSGISVLAICLCILMVFFSIDIIVCLKKERLTRLEAQVE